eukprot:4139277-Lingulodinium_polyedra.AAC.1
MLQGAIHEPAIPPDRALPSAARVIGGVRHGGAAFEASLVGPTVRRVDGVTRGCGSPRPRTALAALRR